MEKDSMIKTIVIVILAIVTSIAMILANQNKGKKEVEITMDINAGIPFKWEYKISDEKIVKFVKQYVKEDNNKDGMVGAKVSTNYVFEGLKEGKTQVIFSFVDITDGTISKQEIYTLKVDKNKNIEIVSE